MEPLEIDKTTFDDEKKWNGWYTYDGYPMEIAKESGNAFAKAAGMYPYSALLVKDYVFERDTEYVFSFDYKTAIDGIIQVFMDRDVSLVVHVKSTDWTTLNVPIILHDGDPTNNFINLQLLSHSPGVGNVFGFDNLTLTRVGPAKAKSRNKP